VLGSTRGDGNVGEVVMHVYSKDINNKRIVLTEVKGIWKLTVINRSSNNYTTSKVYGKDGKKARAEYKQKIKDNS